MNTRKYSTEDRRTAKRITRHPLYQRTRERAASFEKEAVRLDKEMESTVRRLRGTEAALTDAHKEIEDLKAEIAEAKAA